mgnify:CR=1 FL=1
MIGFSLEPFDTLFFRDGTPFSSESASQDEVGGLFPPSPLTVVGALKAALARCQGWDGYSAWSDELKAVLGCGDDPGCLTFIGPIVAHEVAHKGDFLYPMPRHVVGEVIQDKWTPRGFLSPGPPVCCDLGDQVRLPQLVSSADSTDHTFEPTNDMWVTATGFSKILQHQLPAEGDVIEPPWRQEVRVGLERDDSTRTAKEGLLYTARHVRLKSEVKLIVYIDGIPDGWKVPHNSIVPLGGESRVSFCGQWDKELSFDGQVDKAIAEGRVALIALTPIDLDEKVITGREPIPNLAGSVSVISACIDRHQRIGGWDSVNRGPLPLRSLLPAGSVLFCTTDSPKEFGASLAGTRGYLSIGNRTEYGFGLVALTTWSEQGQGE